MSHTSQKVTEPLLSTSANPKSATAEPLSAGTQYAIKALSYVRIATGVACLVGPQFTCALFRYNVPVGSALLVRMVGARDGVLGELLLTAEDKNAPNG